MKIQWILIAALLAASLMAEAEEGFICWGEEQQQKTQAELNEKSLENGCYQGLNSQVGLSLMKDLDASAQVCLDKAKSAKSGCLACINSGMQKTVATVSTLISVASSISSVTNSCSKFNEALKIAQAGLGVYNAYCGMTQQSCSTGCKDLSAKVTDARKALLEAKVAAAAIPGNPQTALIEKDLNCLGITDTVISKISLSCSDYKRNMVAASANLAGIVASSVLSGQCKKETASVDCTTDPTNAACVKALDCSIAANASNTTCICQKAPNTAGCAGYVGSSGNPANTSDGNTNENIDTPALNLPSSGAGVDAAAISPTSGGGGNSAASGGGGGGGGLSGGSSADGSKGKTAAGKGLNANILSGYEGGGGGGSFRGGNYGSSGNSDLQAYLPKGAKDPARNPATQLFGGGQVTGAGSKSNFEKVNERYGEAKSSLLLGQ